LRRVAGIASASGNGKTTLGRALAQRLAVPFVELDALVHAPAGPRHPTTSCARWWNRWSARTGG